MERNDVIGDVRFFAPYDEDGNSRVERVKDMFSGTELVNRLGGMEMEGAAGTTGLLFVTVCATGPDAETLADYPDETFKRIEGRLFNAGSGRGGMRLGFLVKRILGDVEEGPDVDGQLIDAPEEEL